MMRRAIEEKRDGGELTEAQWEAIVASYMSGAIDDAQMAALAMASVWRGLTIREATALTRAMVASGEVVRHVGDDIVVDKHSSGGVSDIVSLVAVPLVAAAGVRVAKLSGRALGHTGGTLDKLEAIPGFNVTLSHDRFVQQVARIGCAIAAQSETLVPADRRLYRLRDHTGTVPSFGLIAASIVSKKVAGGAHAFVFDVKAGSSAFTRHPHTARELADMLVAISRAFGRKAHAIVSDMNEPLGRSIGTGIEVIEARDFLRNADADARLREQSLHVASAMLELGGISDARAAAVKALESGSAYEKFAEMLEAQGASRSAVDELRLPDHVEYVTAERDGFVASIDGVTLGHAAREWSAKVPTAGIRVLVRTGERVERGTILAELYGSDSAHVARVRRAFEVADDSPAERPLVYLTI